MEENKINNDKNGVIAPDDFATMTTDEYAWIKKRHGITWRQLGENAVELLERKKPYTDQALLRWLKTQEYMKGWQIQLLFLSLQPELFRLYRRTYAEEKAKYDAKKAMENNE